MILRTASTDQELVEACLDGDEAAWAELIQKYQRLSQLRDAQNLPKWLITVARRKSVDVVRRWSRTTELAEDEFCRDPEVEVLQRHYDLERALEQLPDRSRELLALLYFSEEPLSYLEIAERLGMPVSSIGPTRARSLQKLRKLMESR